MTNVMARRFNCLCVQYTELCYVPVFALHLLSPSIPLFSQQKYITYWKISTFILSHKWLLVTFIYMIVYRTHVTHNLLVNGEIYPQGITFFLGVGSIFLNSFFTYIFFVFHDKLLLLMASLSRYTLLNRQQNNIVNTVNIWTISGQKNTDS